MASETLKAADNDAILQSASTTVMTAKVYQQFNRPPSSNRNEINSKSQLQARNKVGSFRKGSLLTEDMTAEKVPLPVTAGL